MTDAVLAERAFVNPPLVRLMLSPAKTSLMPTSPRKGLARSSTA